MIRPLLLTLLLMLSALPLFSAGCKSAPAIVVLETPVCDPGTRPVFPRLAATACGNQVCLPPGDAAALWAWVREDARWHERAQLCLDIRDTPRPTKEPALRKDLADLAADLAHPDVTFTVHVVPCDAPNAFYWPTTHRIELCEQILEEDPGTVRVFLAHEIAHAWIMQLDIPYTGSHEAAADELAMVLLVLSDRAEDLSAAASYWLHETEQHGDIPPWAEHPSNLQRYHRLRCAHAAALKKYAPMCSTDLGAITLRWARLVTGR